MRIQKIILGLIVFGSASLNAYADGNALGNSELNERIAALEKLLQYVTVVEGEINGVAGPHFIIEGANVHVRSGALSTGEGCFSSNAADCPTRTGLGNLIVGYNEPRPVGWDPNNECATNPDATDSDGFSICTRRNGSHHLVVGQHHNFVGHGGVVMGLTNETIGSHTTVLGGRFNSSTGRYSSVSGGQMNAATSHASSVSGGYMNRADGPLANVSGGYLNVASGESSSVSAGQQNIASGLHSAVSGGTFNVAEGEKSSVSGGQDNFAGAFASSISGGINSLALGSFSSVSGGDSHIARGAGSSISGGQMKTADADFCTVGDNGTDC